MRITTDLFQIDGQPMLAPDKDMAISLEDVEASDSGRDESGFLHRIVMRQAVGRWTFSYTGLTQQEYGYMEGLFAGKESFRFAYPAPTDGTPRVATAYRKQHKVRWHSIPTGDFCSYTFDIVTC